LRERLKVPPGEDERSNPCGGPEREVEGEGKRDRETRRSARIRLGNREAALDRVLGIFFSLNSL
jgi:hypothetical protein